MSHRTLYSSPPPTCFHLVLGQHCCIITTMSRGIPKRELHAAKLRYCEHLDL